MAARHLCMGRLAASSGSDSVKQLARAAAGYPDQDSPQLHNMRAFSTSVLSFLSIAARSWWLRFILQQNVEGQRRQPAIRDRRTATRRAGWHLFAGPSWSWFMSLLRSLVKKSDGVVKLVLDGLL
jgi:hypothetical protein